MTLNSKEQLDTGTDSGAAESTIKIAPACAKRRLRWLTVPGLLALVVGGSVFAAVNVTSSTPSAAGTTGTPYVDGGDYPSVTTSMDGKVTFTPPSAGSESQYTASLQDVYSAFESTSPAAAVAPMAGYAQPEIFKGTYTNLAFGPTDPETHVITPLYQDTPVWIIEYAGVQWPDRGSGSGTAVAPPAGPNGTYAPSQLLPGKVNVYAISTPDGQCVDTIVVPADGS